jgi:hypothetical protein
MSWERVVTGEYRNPATLNRQVVGSIPTASTIDNLLRFQRGLLPPVTKSSDKPLPLLPIAFCTTVHMDVPCLAGLFAVTAESIRAASAGNEGVGPAHRRSSTD